MISNQERLERSYRRSIRNLEDEVRYLRTMLYDATHEVIEDCDDPDHQHGVEIPVMVPRQEEETGKTDVDSFLKSMLMD